VTGGQATDDSAATIKTHLLVRIPENLSPSICFLYLSSRISSSSQICAHLNGCIRFWRLVSPAMKLSLLYVLDLKMDAKRENQ
jgi:hypothetical protein